MDKIKILYVVDTIVGPSGGTEKHILELIRRLDRGKFQIYLGCLQPSQWLKDNPPTCPQIMLNFKGYFRPNLLGQIFKMAKFIRKEKIQIVQSFFLEGNVIGVLAAKLAGVPHILVARRNLGYWNTPLRILVLRFLRHLTTGYVANCQAVKNYVITVEKVPAEKIKVIYNGIDPQFFQDCPADSFKKIFPADKLVIGIVANLKEIKGIQYFLEAAKIASEKRKDLLFAIIGGGYAEERFRNMARQLGLEDTVRFLGIREDLRPFLQTFDVAVNSSLTEGLSNSILEYMAACLPIIATKVGGNPELVEEGVTGLLVPPADSQALAEKILFLAENENLRKRLGHNARKKVQEKFSLSRQERELEDFYSSLVKMSSCR